MEIWCDTAKTSLVRSMAHLGCVSGVTTNPIILSEPQLPTRPLIQDLLEIQSGPVAIQVTKAYHKAIFEEAKRLHDFSPRILVKVPMTLEGIKAMADMQKAQIPTLATAVFSAEQFILAAKLSVDYVAPYLSHMARLGIDTIAELDRMQTMIQRYGFKTKVMAASLKSLQEINIIAELGVGAITLPENCLNQWMATHPLTGSVIQMFDEPWEKYIAKFPDPLFG